MLKGKKRQILIVDNDANNLKLLESHFEDADYRVDTVESDALAIEKIERHKYDVILSELSSPAIDGNAILKHLQRLDKNQDTHVIFLTPKSDVWNRVKSLKLGAKDYIIKPVYAREIVTRVNMVIDRVQAHQQKRLFASKEFSGRLEDLSPIDLIEILGQENKTGILNLYNENGYNGYICFQAGALVRAKTSGLKAEEAVYRMMTWERGRFTMIFEDREYEDQISISNLGLLLQGAYRMEMRNELIKSLPSMDAVLISNPKTKKSLPGEKSSEFNELASFFDGERTLGRIIDDSQENEIVLLKKIVNYYNLGYFHTLRNFNSDSTLEGAIEVDTFVVPKIEPDVGNGNSNNGHSQIENLSIDQDTIAFWDQVEGEPELQSDDKAEKEDMAAIEKSESESLNHQSLLVIGDDNAYRHQFVESISYTDSRVLEMEDSELEEIYHGKLELRGGYSIDIISCSTQNDFSSILDYLAGSAQGYILLIDSESKNWKYHRYLASSLRQHSNLKGLVVVVDAYGRVDGKQVRRELGMQSTDLLHILNDFNRNVCRRMIFSILEDTNNRNEHVVDEHVNSITY